MIPETNHRVYFSDARNSEFPGEETVDLVVTSPPYPMIEMWDKVFTEMNPDVGTELKSGRGDRAFGLMHDELKKVWKRVYKAVRQGGFICINIGDATRRLGNSFMLYPNHATIIEFFRELGAHPLPVIFWNKPTNSPNKFMGSGMLPAGAYVTLEHEYILIFRKGKKRTFSEEQEKKRRRRSAYFWEERNTWFSDRWNLVGEKQKINNGGNRLRSGAFPFDLAYRLIHMYSLQGDTVMDPFLGTGTTMFAAMASCRSSIGIEIDSSMKKSIDEKIIGLPDLGRGLSCGRLQEHIDFIQSFTEKGKPVKHYNEYHGFPVVTSQEREIRMVMIDKLFSVGESGFRVTYKNVSRETCEYAPKLIGNEGKGPLQTEIYFGI